MTEDSRPRVRPRSHPLPQAGAAPLPGSVTCLSSGTRSCWPKMRAQDTACQTTESNSQEGGAPLPELGALTFPTSVTPLHSPRVSAGVGGGGGGSRRIGELKEWGGLVSPPALPVAASSRG